MTLHENAISVVESNNSATIDEATAKDNGVNLESIVEPYFRPDDNTIVCGALDEEKVAALAAAGVELVLNLQPDDELNFDERAAVERAGMHYEQLPISGASDLKQLNILAFDNFAPIPW